jgi:16S rRNA C967 or C1407 C5-methylase (RsmB/RsmF family)
LLKGSRGSTDSMPDSDLSRKVELTLRALPLITKGASERGAILHVTHLDPSLSNVKREALSLVLEILNEQDLLDKLIQFALPDERVSTKALGLYRLATHLIQRAHDKESLRRFERILRNVTPPESFPSLQLLLGTVVALDPNRQWSKLTDSEKIGLETHHPPWWVEYCFRLIGRGETIKLLSASLRPRYIRVNPLKNRGRTSLPVEAKRVATTVTKVWSNPSMYTVNGSPSVLSKFFSQGLFQVQDLASFLAVKSAHPKPGESVLDVCSAPGGKTATLAQFMKNRGRIVSVDYSRSRMRSWRREVSRLGVKIAEPVVGDATNLAVRGNFDLAVIDPPCTGTGILDRNPSMKWHLTPELIERYSRIQHRILDSVWPLLSDGGRILYCTCSLTVEENENIVSTFLKSHLEFETRPILKEYGSPGLVGLADCRRLWPHRDNTAGYFVALMQRVT